MLCNFLKSTLFIAGFCCFSMMNVVNAAFPETIDWELSQFRRVTQKITSTYDDILAGTTDLSGRQGSWKREIMCDNILFGKTRLGMVEKDNDKIFVSFKGADSLFSKAFWSYSFPGKTRLKGCEGNCHQGIISLYKAISRPLQQILQESFSQGSMESIEFVFSGYGVGGALALCAAADFAYEQKDSLTSNQVKVVTFSAPKVVDEDLKKSLHALIGQANIIQFINRLDVTTTRPFVYKHAGLQVYILPSEQMRDAYHNTERWVTSLSRSTVLLCSILYSIRNYRFFAGDLSENGASIRSFLSQVQVSNLSPSTFFDWLATLLILKPFFREVAALPSDATMEAAIHYMRINIENALSNGYTKENIPDSVGEVGFFNVRRSLWMKFLSRYY